MSEVKLENIIKKYDTKTIINNINLTISDGEFLVLVGASGCGKSTLLRMIAGLENISSGNIYIDSVCVNNIHPKDRDIAMVFQNYALYPHLSVYDNMAFPLKMRNFKKEDIKVKVKEAAEILDLQDLLNRKPKQLSGGQRQRVALGRAIVRKPKVFLMDEPLSNLDAKLRVQMRAEIKKLHEKLKTTFIYVTHDQTEALTMGDKIAIIEKGEIQQIGIPEEVYNTPANTFVAGFLGSPAMNFIPCSIENNTIKLNQNVYNLTNAQQVLLKNRKNVILGIRPEDISFENSFKININADITEMLGNEKITYFNINNSKCAARLPISFIPEHDKELFLNTEKFYFFDIDSKKLIT